MKIILGISGSIAAYKAAYLTRLLVKNGAEVKVIMTRAAADFISPLTLSTLSKNEVITDIHSESAWNNHVELGLWADAMIVAPATANTLAKLANGLCDNILSAVYLSARCPVFVAPAMDVDMWHHPATQQNMSRLTSFGIQVIPVEHGELASGLVGEGRMAEPEHIVAFLDKSLTSGRAQPLQGKSALVTAGPTFEALDPVRFLGNHSSGKMGIAIAETLRSQGAEVTLVLGPTDLSPTDASIQVIRVNAASDMYDACKDRFPQTDITVLAAAVADYRPKEVSETKIKKQSDDLTLELVRTVDIAASLGKMKTDKQLLIGFALETNNEEENALAKLKKKNFDFIVLNTMRDKGAGFGHDTNKIVILKSSGEKIDYALKSKSEVARDIVAEIIVAANQ
ncbi:MAG: bifunctional phosphopantothenoylcysteine decarboxylase/phosphopantothenate--cysteine ligase CoaBC [Saprospiraceae bacterium]